MSTGKTLESIYIDLDALLDTRLGTLSLINKGIADKVLLSGNYHSRDEDVFEGIDKEVFKLAYSKRNTFTLANSMLTNIMAVVRKLVSGIKEQAIIRPFAEGAEVVINCFPYELSEDENIMIGKAVNSWLQDTAVIKIINCDKKEITPEHCKSNYSVLIMYDYGDWVNIHADAFARTQIPDILLLAPKIYFEKKPSEAELAEAIKDAMHPMKATEFLVSTVVELKLIDIKNFSIISDK